MCAEHLGRCQRCQRLKSIKWGFICFIYFEIDFLCELRIFGTKQSVTNLQMISIVSIFDVTKIALDKSRGCELAYFMRKKLKYDDQRFQVANVYCTLDGKTSAPFESILITYFQSV